MKAHKIIDSKQHPSKLKKRLSASKLKLVKKCSAGANTALDVYLQSLAPSGRKSMKSLLLTVGKILMTEQPGVVVWHRINYQQIQRVRAVLVEKGFSVNTINLALAAINGVGKTAMNLGLMDYETLTRLQAIKRIKGASLPKGRYITSQDISAMVEQCNKRRAGVRGVRDKALLLVGCYAGLRCAEITGLRVMDFDANRGVIRVVNGKGKKQRELFLSADVVVALNEWIRCLPEGDEGFLFRRLSKSRSVASGGLSEWGVAVILRELQERSGVQRFTVHDTRRSFISALLEKNVDLNVIRKLAGHSEVTTTAKYDRRGDSVLRAASKSIHA